MLFERYHFDGTSVRLHPNPETFSFEQSDYETCDTFFFAVSLTPTDGQPAGRRKEIDFTPCIEEFYNQLWYDEHFPQDNFKTSKVNLRITLVRREELPEKVNPFWQRRRDIEVITARTAKKRTFREDDEEHSTTCFEALQGPTKRLKTEF